MNLSEKQIAYKKVIGKLGSCPVIHMVTKGGLNILTLAKYGEFHTLAIAPHVALAKHLAEKKEPDIIWTDLRKSEDINPADFKEEITKYDAITNKAIEIEKELKGQ